MDTSYSRLNYTGTLGTVNVRGVVVLIFLVPPTRHRRSYKPTILRVPWMLLVAAFACGLIGLLEYAARELPHADRGRHQTISDILERSINKRQDASSGPGASVPTTTSRPPTAGFAPQSDYVSTKVTTSGQYMDPLTVGSSSYVPVIASSAAESDYIGTASAASADYISPTVGAAPGESYIATTSWQEITTSATRTSSATSKVTTTDSKGSATVIQTVVPLTTVVPVVQNVTFEANHGGRVATITWPLWQVFVGNYLAVLIAIIFRIFWTAIYNKIKLIEPFTQLARPGGAVAANTMHAYYLSSNFTPDQIKTLFRGHWMIFWASIVFAVTAVIPSLSTEVVFLDTNYQCASPNLASPNPCWPPRLSVDPTVVRWLQGLLGFVAVMTLGLMLWLARTNTGLAHDPSSIAAVAALVHHPEVLEDFRSIRDEASLKEVRAILGEKKYILDDYRQSDGIWRYGIIPVQRACIDYEWADKQFAHTDQTRPSDSKRRINIDTWWDGLFLLFLIGVLGVLVAYFKIGDNSGFNNFFNSNTFGPRFLMAALATIISMNWKRIEREVHALTPYYELSQSPSPAHSTILLRKRGIPYTAIFGMLYNKHFFAAALAFTAILADVLVISLAGVPYSPGQIWMELIVCSYLSMVVLGTMIIAVITLLVWRRKSPDLPRAPDTLLGVISYLADSNMLGDFDGLENVEKKEMDDRIGGLGKRYGYGRNFGMDGQKRFMVDEELRLVV